MEKVLWMAIALLWLGMIGTAAFAAEPQRPVGTPANITADDSTTAGTPAASLLSVTHAMSPASPVREISMTLNQQPMIEVGQHGGAELAGAFLIGSAALWSARRRRII